jgi:uncharacterized protein (DUF488 family)
METLRTVGHGTLAADDLASLLDGAGVQLVVDVRRYPGSRRHPHVARDEMAHWLPTRRIAYEWAPALGGRRKPSADSPNVALRNLQFRAYADHMATDGFAAAVDDLLVAAAERATAVLCSESVWWRCHRRLLADYVVLARELPVEHLMHDGRLVPHPPTDGVRRAGGGVVYDALGGR